IGGIRRIEVDLGAKRVSVRCRELGPVDRRLRAARDVEGTPARVEHDVPERGLALLRRARPTELANAPRGLADGHAAPLQRRPARPSRGGPEWPGRPPRGTASVAPKRTSVFGRGIPSRSDASIASPVSWPWPCGERPLRTTAPPSFVTSPSPHSLEPPPFVI